ncbi:unnamed protein product [Triticum turgidum subsp. durum]|uniref:BPM/SPOP BACK domain-containing protein n=1 Tax=Triticum turgidum subsp. durum TaxID=4567 RepID=A0A9R0TXR0_TRITD|nr:unnamed protein product [Triticum turgidum subsp. durum]
MAAEAAFSAPLPVLPFPLPAPTATPAPADNSKSSSPLLGGSPNPPPASVLPTPASSRTGGSELPSEPLVSATTPEQLTLATAFRRGLLAKSRPDFLVRRPDPSSAPFMFTPGDALLHYVLENFSSPVFTPVAPAPGLDQVFSDAEMEKDDMEEDEAQDVEEEDAMRLEWLQDLFAAADRYDLEQLKFICEKHLSEEVRVSSVGSTLALTERHHCHGLKEACLRFIQAQSLSCLQRIMETNGWEYLNRTNPSVLNELITKLASNQSK